MKLLLEMLYPSTIQGRRATRTAVAMVAAAYIAIAFHFASPYWSVISAIIIMERFIGNTLERGAFRLIGSISGALIGFILAGFAADHLIFFLLCFFSIFTMTCYFSLTSLYPYAFIMGGLTSLLVLGNLVFNPSNVMYAAIWRTVEVITGTLIAMMSILIILPRNSEKIIKNKIQEQMSNINQLLTQIVKQYFNVHKTADIYQQLDASLKQLNIGLELCTSAQKEHMHSPIAISRLRQIIQWQAKVVKYLKYIHLNFEPNTDYQIMLEIKEDMYEIIQVFEDIFQTIDLTKSSAKMFKQKLQTLHEQFRKLDLKIENKRQSKEIYEYSTEQILPLHQFMQNIEAFIDLFSEFNFLTVSQQAKEEEATISHKFAPFLKQEQANLSIKQSIKAGISGVLAVGIWMFSGFAGGIQGLISTLVISLQKNIYDAQLIAEMRILGCFLGGGVGLLSLHLFVFDLKVLLIILFIFGWIFSYFSYSDSKYSYGALQANIALALTLVSNNTPPTNISMPLERLFGIIIAIVATFIVARLVWPAHPKKLLKSGLSTIQTLLFEAFKAIFIDKNLSKPQRLELRMSLSSYFQQNMQLLNSIKTYSHDKNVQVKNIEEMNNQQKYLATIMFSLADSCEFNSAFRLAIKLDINLDEYIAAVSDILSCKNDIKTLSISSVQSAILKNIKHLRQLPMPLPYSRHEIANLMTLLSGLINILNCLQNITANAVSWVKERERSAQHST